LKLNPLYKRRGKLYNLSLISRMIFRLLGVPVDRKQGSYVLKTHNFKRQEGKLKLSEI
jgi:hypothetical protein